GRQEPTIMVSRDRERLSEMRTNGNPGDRKSWMTALESRVTQAEPSLNSSRSKLIRAILDSAEDNYFLSSRALAKRYEVDKATIVRTIQALGYERYADFVAALSYLLAYGLTSLGYDAEAPIGSTGNLHQKVSLLGSRDVLIAISFGRCLQATVDAALHARENGVPTFGITDSEKTPIAR